MMQAVYFITVLSMLVFSFVHFVLGDFKSGTLLLGGALGFIAGRATLLLVARDE